MNNVKRLRSRAYTLTEREIQIVKLVLCSALYPQLAIGDEHNPHRKSNELVFHIKSMHSLLNILLHVMNLTNTSFQNLVKSFLSIHPSSVIAAHPEWVQGHAENVRKGKSCSFF